MLLSPIAHPADPVPSFSNPLSSMHTLPDSAPRSLASTERPSLPRRATAPSPPPSLPPLPLDTTSNRSSTSTRRSSRSSKSQGGSPVLGTFGRALAMTELPLDLGQEVEAAAEATRKRCRLEDTRQLDDDSTPFIPPPRTSSRTPSRPISLAHPASTTTLPVAPPSSQPPVPKTGETFDFAPFVAQLDSLAGERARLESADTRRQSDLKSRRPSESEGLPEFEEFLRESFRLGGEEDRDGASPGVAAEDRMSVPPTIRSSVPPLMTEMAAALPSLFADLPTVPRSRSRTTSGISSLPFPLSASSQSPSLLAHLSIPSPTSPFAPRLPRDSNSLASLRSVDLIDFSSSASHSSSGKLSLAPSTSKMSLRIDIPGHARQDSLGSRISTPTRPELQLMREKNVEEESSDEEEDVEVDKTEVFDLPRPVPSLPPSQESNDDDEVSSDHHYEGFEYTASNISMTPSEVALSDSEDPLTDTDEEEEEEDPDTHLLYVALSTSTIPALRKFWDAATLVLVPPRRSVPSLEVLTSPAPALATPTSSPARGLGFEFVRGGKGVEPTMREREVEERGRREKERQEEQDRLTRYLGWHCFRLETGNTAGSGQQSWRSVGGGKDEEGGFVRVRMVPATRLAHVEWVLERHLVDSEVLLPPPPLPAAYPNSEGDTTPTAPSPAFPPIEPRVSSDSEASSLLPHTPPSPLPSRPTPRIELDDDPSTPTLASKPPLEAAGPPDASPTPIVATTSPSPAASAPLQLPAAPRALPILSETTIYRRPRPPPPPLPVISSLPSPAAPTKTSKSAFRAPKWLRRGVGMGSGSSLKAVAEEKSRSASGSSLPGGASARVEEKTPMLERVRVMSVGGVVVPGWEQLGAGHQRDEFSTDDHRSNDKRASTFTTSSGLGRRLGRGHSSTSLLLSLSRHASFDHSGLGGRRRAGSTASTRSARSVRSTRTAFEGASEGESSALSRDFQADIAFFAAPPPPLSALASILASSLRFVRSLVRDFEGSFAYIKGFDVYTVQRIRKGIFDKAWLSLSRDLETGGELALRLLNEEQATLLHILENVIMGLLHAKIYTASVQPLYSQENANINHILHLYRSRHPRLAPADLGVDVCDLGAGDALAGAVAAMRRIGREGTPASLELVQACATAIDDEDLEETRRLLTLARTPLGCIGSMRQAIEEIVEAVKRVEQGLRVAPDDLIPLLAWVTVQSEVEDLESVLYYVKTFRLSDDLAAEFDWSFVTFQASLAFLLSDPLGSLETSPLPPPTFNLPFPSSTSPSATRRASELHSFRPRRSSIHQHSPYATAEQRLSPPASPRSPRVLNSSAWTPSPSSARLQSRAGTLCASASEASSISALAGLPARERRLSWQQGMRSHQRRSSVSPTPNRADARMTASEQMPPPSWTTNKHQRRQSLGVLPSATSTIALGSPFPPSISHSLDDTSITAPLSMTTSAESPRTRTTSVASSSPAQELQIRPRIVLPPRSTHSSYHRSNTPTGERPPNTQPLVRSQSSMSSRKIGPDSAAIDMRRSESEGSPTVTRVPHSETWSLWSGSAAPSSPATSERRTSHAPSDRPASAGGDENSWWNWTREHIGSAGPSAVAVASSLSIGSDDGAAGETVAPGPRARRHSTSAVDLLNLGPRTLSLPLEPPSSSSARLAAILAARNAGASRPPRPRSVMSISSMSSLDSATSHATATEDYLTAAATLSSSAASLPIPGRRKITKSRTWRELPTSNLVSKPLAPQLDSSSVISFPTSSVARSNSSTSASSCTSAIASSSPRLRPASPLQRRHTEL